MAKEGKGAPQIHAALLKLDIDGCERTVSRYLAKYGKKTPTTDQRQRYRTFLANHRDCLAGMDFCVVPTATFRLLYILVVIHHGRRKILGIKATKTAYRCPWQNGVAVGGLHHRYEWCDGQRLAA